MPRTLHLAIFLGLLLPLWASTPVAELDQSLAAASDATSPARQRLAVRRVIRDAEQLVEAQKDTPDRFPILEFLFRARQQLIALDDDPQHRKALLETCRQLVKAPDDMALLRLEADLLLSQAEQAKKGEGADRSEALRQFVARYVSTPAGTRALRAAMLMALEFGDSRLVDDLRAITAEHYSSDLEMITFLRDNLGGQVFGVPFVGHYQRSDDKMERFPMDVLGHSSMVIFWSKDNENVLQYLTDMAAAYKLDQRNIDGRIEIISVNLDELPDAGESIIRAVGADWPCLHFPGGRDSPVYKAYVRTDPLNLRVAPTGQTAMITHDYSRKRSEPRTKEIEQEIKQIKPSEDLTQYIENFRRATIRGWNRDEYAMNLSALMTGDFLIFDPETTLDPLLPPELKATGAKAGPLKRSPNSVPEETLAAIQNCLIAPPHRYHAGISEIRTSYQNMVDLSRKAIADHPEAPDLWIVRNRLMIGLLGLWKTDFKLEHFEAAVAEAELAMEAGFPDGTDLIARFCLARQALRDPQADDGAVIDGLVADYGGNKAPGPALAVACLLALDVADEKRFQDYRKAILKNHTEPPMMWIFSGFLLDRYHEYWLFQVPFTAGWSFGRREKYEMQKGDAEEAQRMLKAELPTIDGSVFRIPEDLKAEYTAIFLAQPPPWKGRERDDPKPPSPGNMLRNFPDFVFARPDLDLVVAMYNQADEAAIREGIKLRGNKEQLEYPILQLPDGLSHPLVQRLGIQSGKEAAVIVNKQGRILAVRSGLSFGEVTTSFENTVMRQDELKVNKALERGDVAAAEKLILSLAPPYDPEAKDERGRKLPEPKYSMYHLRARARVYMALKQWDKALADAEFVVQKLLGAAGGMSLRTDELDESEALRDQIRKEIKKIGNLNPVKVFERLNMLHDSDEKALLLSPSLHYHRLKGSAKYSIDADSRKSPWRITFQWESEEMKNVELVRIEDTH